MCTSVLYLGDNPKNPYVKLLLEALTEEGLDVTQIDWPLAFPLTRSALSHRNADVIHVGWLFGFYMTDDFTGSKIIDSLITLGRASVFILDIIFVNLLSISVVWTVHNTHHHENKYERFERIINEIAFVLFDSIVVKCEEAAEIVCKEYAYSDREKMEVIGDGNYISTYENNVSKAEARDWLSVDADSFVYLYFGLIREYKGVPDLIATFNDANIDDSELYIVGQPWTEEIASELKSQSKELDEIQLVLKYVDDEQIQYYLNMADVLVLPYRNILNSGSVHLGLSFGVPIIAPKTGCIPATIPEDNPFLYDHSDPDGLRRQLETVHEHPNLTNIGKANYDYAKKQDWKSTAREFKNVYEGLETDN
ncbi:glycosyltransferase [Haloarcula sp. CBA1131]|nr:glycosyltransferase [Haloarcula sp. CBA1131]